jgi:hypothetical protein
VTRCDAGVTCKGNASFAQSLLPSHG